MVYWAYLLLDHMGFWKPYVDSCVESIRQRLLRLKCPFHPAGMDSGFAVIAFIDNTMNATCRPEGVPG